MKLDDEPIDTVEQHVSDWLADEGVPGASLALVDADGHIYAEGFGSRNLHENVPATPRTLYGMGSVTKSVTAMAVARLVEAGELSFDDSVAEYVPHYADAPEEPVTVHDLLSHSSGYPSDESTVALIARKLDVEYDPIPLASSEDFQRHLAGATDERAEGFFYNNTGYTVLAAIIEEVTGNRFATHVEETILDPLGMERATFAADALDDGDAMTPYRMDETPMEEAFPFDERKHAPGGLVAPVTEMGRYLRTYINGGELDGEWIVDSEIIARLTDRHATRKTDLDGREQDYGYGWMIEEFLGDELISHGGSVAVSTAWVGYLDDAEVGVALACNTAPAVHPTTVGMSVLALLCDEQPRDVVPAVGLRDKLETVVGTYESYRSVVTTEVERRGGGL